MEARRALVVGIFAALAIAWALVIVFVRAFSDDEPEASDGVADPSSGPSEVAEVYPSHEEACAALGQAKPNIRVTEARAMKDRDALADSILGGDVTMVGLYTCGHTWVVSVGVSTPTAVVPASGPHGTPVVATIAGPFVAF